MAFPFLGNRTAQVGGSEHDDGKVLHHEQHERESIRDPGEIVLIPASGRRHVFVHEEKPDEHREDVSDPQHRAAAAAREANDVVIEVRPKNLPAAMSKNNDVQRDHCQERKESGEPAPGSPADDKRHDRQKPE